MKFSKIIFLRIRIFSSRVASRALWRNILLVRFPPAAFSPLPPSFFHFSFSLPLPPIPPAEEVPGKCLQRHHFFQRLATVPPPDTPLWHIHAPSPGKSAGKMPLTPPLLPAPCNTTPQTGLYAASMLPFPAAFAVAPDGFSPPTASLPSSRPRHISAHLSRPPLPMPKCTGNAGIWYTSSMDKTTCMPQAPLKGLFLKKALTEVYPKRRNTVHFFLDEKCCRRHPLRR